MQGKHVVAAWWAMLLVCAICCVPVVSLELFVSDDGVDEVGSTHVQTIPFAVNQDGTEVDMTLGPQEYPLSGTHVEREIVRFRGFSRSGTALVSPGTSRVLSLASTEILFADLTVRDGYTFSASGGCVFVSNVGGDFVNVTLSNVLFVNCSCLVSGGAIASLGSLYVVNSEFANNEAGFFGGGVYSFGGSDIRNSTFRGNTANIAGGVGIADGPFDTVIDGCYFDNNSEASSPTGWATVSDSRTDHRLLVTNTIFGNNTAPRAIASENALVMDTVEIREVGEYSQHIVTSSLNVTMQRTLLGSVANSSGAAVRSHGMLLDDVVLDAGAIPLAVAAPSMAGSRVAVDRIARKDGGCAHLFEIDGRGMFLESMIGGEVNSTALCGMCESDVNVLGSHPDNEGGMYLGELVLDGVTTTEGDLTSLVYTSTACTSTPVCGSGVFSAMGGVCRHATLEANLTDCMGVLGGHTVLDACGECVPGCEVGTFYVGECGSRVCMTECPTDFYLDLATKACEACGGPTTCSPVGEFLACGAEGAPLDERVCRCPEGTYHDGGVECVACEYTHEMDETCEALGHVVVGCEVGSTSDVSECRNCTALGMFVSADGSTCTGGCLLGELALAGPPGVTVCSPCDAGTHESGGECVACAHDASSCIGDGFAVVECGSGEGSDVSSCTNCTAFGMFVSGDGSMCTGGCLLGELALAGPPGVTVCSPCDAGTHQSGAECVACTHDASNCNGDGFAFVGCGSGEASDVSTCTNCTALGMFVSGDGATCTGGCTAGEVASAGAPGEMVCVPCGVDTHQSGVECEACTHDASNCNGDGFAFVGCGSGESSDVSTCTNCTALGMFVSGNGTTCEGMCSAGELPVGGPPGDTTCSPCPEDTYQLGAACVACEFNAEVCARGFVVVTCGSGETSDVSACTNCTAVGMFVSEDGTSCVGSCPAGEVVVAGEPGVMECAACPRDTYGSGVECVGCANTAVTCSGPEVAVGRCGMGEVNDTSTCMNCTTVGLVPSRDGEACVTAASLLSDGGGGEEGGGGLGGGGIAGVVIGVGIVAVGAWYLLRKRRGMRKGWSGMDEEDVDIDVVERQVVPRT